MHQFFPAVQIKRPAWRTSHSVVSCLPNALCFIVGVLVLVSTVTATADSASPSSFVPSPSPCESVEQKESAWRAPQRGGLLHPIQVEMLPFVEDMLEHAVDGYLTYAFPKDELAAMTGAGREGLGGIWATLIDSLDTIALMRRPRLFRRLARWVEENVSFDLDVGVSGFETNIRVVGGLLSAHFMYEEGIVPMEPDEHAYNGGLLRLAVDLADRLLPAFDTPTGIPYGSINLRHGVPPDETRSTATASAGTYLMEMVILSRATGDPRYEAAARRASQAVYDLRNPLSQLMGNHIDVCTGRWVLPAASVGTGADSTLEYWLKAHAMSGEGAEWERFERLRKASSSMLRQGGFYLQTPMNAPAQLYASYFHCSLASFYPGCLLQGGRIEEAQESLWSDHGVLSYFGAIPEEFQLHTVDTPLGQRSTNYPLRPEHLESVYYLYRATRDPAYLHMGKEFALALHLRTRTPFGFANLGNVVFPHSRSQQDDAMESFVISETLKYLYLLFDECSPLHAPSRSSTGGGGPVCEGDSAVAARASTRVSKVAWLFSTEGHVFPNHAEWLAPGSARSTIKAVPAGLEGSRLSCGVAGEGGDDDGTSIGALASRLRATFRANSVEGERPLPTDEALRQLEAGVRERLVPFTEGIGQARLRNLQGLLTSFSLERQEARIDRSTLGYSSDSTQDPLQQYGCRNHAVHGLDRLSKSVHRESIRPQDY